VEGGGRGSSVSTVTELRVGRQGRGSGAHPGSYPTGTEETFTPGGKWPTREADHSSPSSAKVTKAWSYTTISPHVFMVCCLSTEYGT
jgi:hypothetical protein